MIGKKFGRLTVLEQGMPVYDGRSNRETWECKCDCGNIKVIRGKELKSGGVKSCGCLKREVNKRNTMPIRSAQCLVCNKTFEYQSRFGKLCGEKKCFNKYRSKYMREHTSKSLNNKLREMLKSAKSRSEKYGWDYNLTLNSLMKLAEKTGLKCPYTGMSFEFSSSTAKEKSPWDVSIDRKDSTKGYIIDNVQLVSFIYNLSKHTWDESTVFLFVEKLKKEHIAKAIKEAEDQDLYEISEHLTSQIDLDLDD